ncbi:hypothetical protein JL720_9364 [Aureococcus anophagefferens]|nr:hypothetical protein JL720_9364 [Aureococcus anophagefferens]
MRRTSNAFRKLFGMPVMKLDKEAGKLNSGRVAPDTTPMEDLDMAISENDRRQILVRLHPVVFAKDAPLIEQGTPATDASKLTFLTSGKIYVMVGELKVTELKAPLYVGEGGVFTEKEASASVLAFEDCRGYQLAKADCKQLYASNCRAVKLIGATCSSAPSSARSSAASRACSASSEALQFVLAVEELKKLVSNKDSDMLLAIRPTILEDVEHLYTTHLLEAAPENGNLGVSLEINLDAPSRKRLYEGRDDIIARGKEEPLAYADFASLFDKEYKKNVGEIRRGTIPRFLKSPEYEEFKTAMYPLPADDAKYEQTASYSNWIVKQKPRGSKSLDTPPGAGRMVKTNGAASNGDLVKPTNGANGSVAPANGAGGAPVEA